MGPILVSLISAIITRLQSTSTDRIVLMFCQYHSTVTALTFAGLPLIHTCSKMRHGRGRFVKIVSSRVCIILHLNPQHSLWELKNIIYVSFKGDTSFIPCFCNMKLLYLQLGIINIHSCKNFNYCTHQTMNEYYLEYIFMNSSMNL